MYFQIYQPAVFNFHLQHCDIELQDIFNDLCTSLIHIHSFIKIQSFEYCNTVIDFLLYFQNFHLIGWFNIKFCLLHNHILCECIWFSLLVHHSRLSILLSVLIPLIWFTCFLFSGLGMNAIATSLCTEILFKFILINKYHHLLILCFNILSFQ